MVSPTNAGPMGSLEESSFPSSISSNGNYDLAVRLHQQQQSSQWDEETQNMNSEASVISQRLVSIRTQLVTISDKTSIAAGGTIGCESDVTEEEMQMALEAQKIMRRLGEIKAKLSRKKKRYSPVVVNNNTSRDSSTSGLASISEAAGHRGVVSMEAAIPTWNRSHSVLPSAVSLGTTPCMSSSSFSTAPGYLNVTTLSSSTSSEQDPGSIPVVVPGSPTAQNHPGKQLFASRSEEERDGAPSSPSDTAATTSMDFTHPTVLTGSPGGQADSPTLLTSAQPFLSPKTASAFPYTQNSSQNSTTVGGNSFGNQGDCGATFSFSSLEHPHPPPSSRFFPPWGRPGTPGRLDHGIGVIVKPLRPIPSLEPIVSLDTSASSELSPILTADDDDDGISVNALDYEMTQTSPLPPQPFPVKAAVTTPSLFDDTFMDVSSMSIEDPLEAAEQGVANTGVERNRDGVDGGASSSACEGGSIMDMFACGSQGISVPLNASDNNKDTTCCDQIGGGAYSVGDFLRYLGSKGGGTRTGK